MHHIPRLLVLPLLFCAACAAPRGATRPTSTRAEGSGLAARVAFHDLRSGARFALASESHTDRVELYSRPSNDLSTKVTSDEVMEELLAFLENETDLGRYAVPGPAPEDTRWTQTVEVETPEGTWHVALARSTPPDERRAFQEAYLNFIALWNNIYQGQAVPGERWAELLGRDPSDPKR